MAGGVGSVVNVLYQRRNFCALKSICSSLAISLRCGACFAGPQLGDLSLCIFTLILNLLTLIYSHFQSTAVYKNTERESDATEFFFNTYAVLYFFSYPLKQLQISLLL